MAIKDQNNASRIRSVAKALMILDLLAANQRDMSLAEIARAMDLPKSTLHGLLATMRDFGYLEQSPFDGRYRLGVHLFEIGNIVANNWDVRKVAGPYIQKLVDELGETVHLVILDKGEVLYIDKRESHQSLRIVSQVGMRLPAHCTGVGKVLLAYLHPSEVKRIIATKGLPRYTRHTITDPRRLEAELEKIRAAGYAVDNEEIMDSLRCVAAPIRDHNGKVCAAISVAGPVARLEGERFRLAVELVTRTAAEISTGLGYRPAAGSDASGA
ncbi:IclR family transcriptional regulator [Neomoorella mulderi]|uniref:Glycerol operon regulatory protein n=1 Tax=Moorella mulderi DSM 14980 TaxID=1122241 RepID=A0A151AX84_9FIRM|nr:IclR family transcriptional regulator [Moorella mulderi]KYH32241.1 acetate operon repressor [Moorella mulderi DSM 14980]